LPGNDGEIAYFRPLITYFPIIPRQGIYDFPPKTRQKQPLTGGGGQKRLFLAILAILAFWGFIGEVKKGRF